MRIGNTNARKPTLEEEGKVCEKESKKKTCGASVQKVGVYMSVLDILQEKIYVLLPLCNYLRVVCGSKVQRHGRRTEEKLERATQIPATMSVVLHAQDIVNSNSLIAVQ